MTALRECVEDAEAQLIVLRADSAAVLALSPDFPKVLPLIFC